MDNALNLRRLNLIGVYGTPANRRALVRLPSGRYKKLKIGDRIDGGKVVAISDDELRYQKRGRNLTLKMPRDEDRSYQNHVIAGYQGAAPDLIVAYESLPPETVLWPIKDFWPMRGDTVLDIGAGPGTIAAWTAQRGCIVTAVEPVAAFRHHGARKYLYDNLSWCDDQLSDLTSFCPVEAKYDTIFVIGVFHHLSPKDQVKSIATLARLLAPSGHLILSLRHGPCPTTRPGYQVSVDQIIKEAQRAGLHVGHLSQNGSIQSGNRRAGVTWTWLVLKHSGQRTDPND